MDKKHCINCRNNFYNDRNSLGTKVCWSLENAKLVKRISIGHWENPPYKDKKVVFVPNCWHSEGTHYIDPEKDLDSRGFWK